MDKKTPAHETLWELIKDIRIGMVTHHGANGQMHAHPLTTQNKVMDDRGELYYFISNQSELHDRLQADNEVSVAYADPSADRYVAISGQASFNDDLAKKEALWSPMAKAWFPEGAIDPNLALLVVNVKHAEYWNVDESKMVQLLKMTKAAITGTPPKNLGEHKELDL
ncbi:pyridoxamine 5'-phosphate oxidase family protein [Simplicispira psychrophila]|uniref:pyridoxamine 5'-phosphate oxidase family protein n=1 Tax=Simplicispira psychrophila TaxID=80882 RepID=UPI00048437BF|nr:pyridoxamine 5'-phosphate oxidase family protein [Simplicispira psychrophila]